MDTWRYEPEFGSLQDTVVSIGNQQMNVPVSGIHNATQGQFYVHNGFVCNDNLQVKPGDMTVSPVGGGQTYVAVPIRRPK